MTECLRLLGGKSKNNHAKALWPENAMKVGCYHVSCDIFLRKLCKSEAMIKSMGM